MPEVTFEAPVTITGDKTGNTTLNRATTHVNEAYSWASMRIESRRRDFARRYAQYRGNMNIFGRDTVQSQLRSQIWIPKSGSLLETVIPRTIGDNPKIELKGRREEFVEEAALMERVLEYYLHAMKFPSVLYFWWKDALIYGTGLVKCIWSYREEERKKDRAPLETLMNQGSQALQDGAEEPGYEIIVTEDMPRVVNVDIMDFFFDYTASSIEKMDFIMEKYELPLDIVKARLKAGKYTGIEENELLSHAAAARELAEDSNFKDERDRAAYGYLGNEGDSAKHRIDQLKKIVLYDYWGRFDINQDGKDENCLITAIGNRAGKVIRAIRNPYMDGQKPYVSANYMPVHNDFLGIGLMEWVEQLQREINTRYNMGVDNANYILNAMVKVRRSASIPDAQLKSRPSGRIDVNEPDDVTPMEMPVVFDKLLAVQQWNDQLWQDITGVSSESAGVRKSQGTAFHRTAGGIFALQQAAEARLKMARLQFEERSVNPLIELCISRIKQFMDAPVTVNIVQPEGMQYITVNPYQINAAEYDLKVVIAPTEQIGRLAEREKWIQTLSLLLKLDPQLMLFEWGNIIHDWIEASGLPNPQRYIGQAMQKLQLMHQLNLINQMGQPPGMSQPMGPGAPQGGGGGGQGPQQTAREVTNAPKDTGMTQSAGEKGRANEQ